MTQAVNEPALRDDLHPCPDAGECRRNPHQAKVAILKSFKDPADHAGVTMYPRRKRTMQE